MGTLAQPEYLFSIFRIIKNNKNKYTDNMERSAFGTLSDAFAAFESDNHSQEQDLALLHPPTDVYASNEEVGDDDIRYAGNIELPGDAAGTIEIHWRHVDSDSNTDDEDIPPAKSNTKKRYQSFFIKAWFWLLMISLWTSLWSSR